MTSSNIQKIVQNNFHLNPWILSKNTNEIVNTCIQKIYKQMPHNFKKDLKPPKIAAARPENKAPIRCFQTQQRDQPIAHIVPQTSTLSSKKSHHSHANHAQLNPDRLMNFLRAGNRHNLHTATSNKKLLKSPNYKIYGSRRFGSSASSSRSSLFRRYDEKRRQKQPYPPQLNCLVRSFHSGRFNESLANYLLPSRNQKVKGNLGSLPEAMKVSSSIQNDLMIIDAAIRNRISVGGVNKGVQGKPINEPFEVDRLQVWKHPPPLDTFRCSTLSELLGKSSGKVSHRKQSQLPPEHRDYGRYQAGRTMQFKHPSPPNELFTARHDRQRTELQEKHRRSRMRKLGLIRDSPRTSATYMTGRPSLDSDKDMECLVRQETNIETAKNKQDLTDVDQRCYSTSSPLSTQMEACRQAHHLTSDHKIPSHFPMVKKDKFLLKEEESALTNSSTAKVQTSRSSRVCCHPSEPILSPTSSKSSTLNATDRLSGPLALAAANISPSMVGKSGYRYDRSNYFPLRKY